MAMTFNHLNLLASADSDIFALLVDTLGLEVGQRPDFPFKGHWLYQGDKALVHIIETQAYQECQLGHLAFELDMNLQELTTKLQQSAIQYSVKQVPDSEIIQVFVRVGNMVFELQTLNQSRKNQFPVFTQHKELV
ncbi:hypothetical protein [Shewanella nanhaiensis]|uniref:VOC domain-containing protein n=1 Tax=Shewanella nanhaiensis TaxID=2864872 RepID=A0ABS7E0U0_9GAMM|nr:hypothetical protein [Shewanella nanhaiensis]MBW8183292.1 hypothetical protein [Shewanella nanhaiensis]